MALLTRLRSEGNGGAFMPFPAYLRARPAAPPSLCHLASLLAAAAGHAASIRGVVTDATGAKITGANVVLISNGQRGCFRGLHGRWQLSDSHRHTADAFISWFPPRAFASWRRPVSTPGALDNIERNLVLEPEWVRESIVVTATGTPTPQPQTSAATRVLGPLDLALHRHFRESHCG